MAELSNSTRRIQKATYVPITLKQPVPENGQALIKFGFLKNLNLQAGEAEKARQLVPLHRVYELLTVFG
jgi:hypothetical protein